MNKFFGEHKQPDLPGAPDFDRVAGIPGGILPSASEVGDNAVDRDGALIVVGPGELPEGPDEDEGSGLLTSMSQSELEEYGQACVTGALDEVKVKGHDFAEGFRGFAAAESSKAAGDPTKARYYNYFADQLDVFLNAL